jgi:hypothetical protein
MDDHVRKLERAWRRAGRSGEAHVRYLVARVQAGALAPERVGWVARLGDADAAAALETLGRPAPPVDGYGWLGELEDEGSRLAARVALAAARTTWPAWERHRDLAASRLQAPAEASNRLRVLEVPWAGLEELILGPGPVEPSLAGDAELLLEALGELPSEAAPLNWARDCVARALRLLEPDLAPDEALQASLFGLGGSAGPVSTATAEVHAARLSPVVLWATQTHVALDGYQGHVDPEQPGWHAASALVHEAVLRELAPWILHGEDIALARRRARRSDPARRLRS